jgi:cell division protein FtsI (penicillin-binding protein 3)
VTDSYEPGSTFKAILAAAALEAGVIRPEKEVFCERGRYRIGRRVIHDHHPEATLTFTEVIEKSSNIGCAKVANMLGRERFAEAIQRFGFGAPTGIDLPGEVAGLVRPLPRWGDIHVATIAFGQGIAVTPLQLVRAFAALANGGFIMRPYVVRRIVTENGKEKKKGRPQVEGRAVSGQTAALVTDILRGVVDRGTGRTARIEGVSLAGKTGTAQKVDPQTGAYCKRARMSSFVAFGPTRDPRLVTLVVVDSPRTATYGSVVAAPAVRRIMEFGLEQRGVRPWVAPVPVGDPGPALLHRVAAAVPLEPLIAPGGVPRFLGLSMRDAVVEARRAGFTLNISGSGYVVAQEPPPGADPIASEVVLEFGPQVY